MLKALRNIVIRTVIITLVLAAISFGSYGLCKGLAWLTTKLGAQLATLGEFAKNNTQIVIALIIIVTIANVLLEIISKRIGGIKIGSRRSKPKTKE